MAFLRLRSDNELTRLEYGWRCSWTVRMALSAAPSRIFRLMVGKGIYLSVLGIAIGLIEALALARVLTSMLVEVKPTDPLAFVFVSVLFLLIAVMASGLPAQRTAGLDPTTAVRNN